MNTERHLQRKEKEVLESLEREQKIGMSPLEKLKEGV